MSMLYEIMHKFSHLLRSLWLFISGVISVGAMYYLLIHVEQGIDVLILSGERLMSLVLTAIAIALWAFLLWYSGRTLSYIRQGKDNEMFSRRDPTEGNRLYERFGIPSPFYQHLPRLLAYNCFVVVQVAILHLPTFYGWKGAELVLALLFHNLLYFFLSKRLTSGKRLGYALTSGAMMTLYVIWLFWMLYQNWEVSASNHPERHRFWLSFMLVVLFCFQVSAICFFVWRRRAIDERRYHHGGKASAVLDFIGFNPAFNVAEAPYFRFLNITAGIALVVYLAAVFSLPFSSMMGPMAFTLLALGILTGLANLLTLFSIRISFNVMVVLIGAAFVFGEQRDPYSVRLLPAENEEVFAKRLDTRTFLRRWFHTRMDRLDTATRFPVYIVLSNGGASRAGLWTSGVLGTLQDESYRSNPQDSFRDHVVCLAGASGGSVGNSVFYSLMHASYAGALSGDEFQKHAATFFEADFLTPALGRLLGPDIVRHVFPYQLPIHNRADALEIAMEQASADALLNRYFAAPLSQLIDTTGLLPALFMNVTQVDNGMPAVISTIRPTHDGQRQDVLSLVDSSNVRNGTGDIRLSTAAVLSSRFPFVSPAGKVFDRYYVDGGYFDNSGGGTVLAFIRELNAFLSDSSETEILAHRHLFTFHILHLTNAEIFDHASPDIHPLMNDLFSPVLTLAGMQGATTDVTNGLLVDAFRPFNTDTSHAQIVYSLYDEQWSADQPGTFEDGYPMSWALSRYQRHRMADALRRENERKMDAFFFAKPQDSLRIQPFPVKAKHNSRASDDS